MKNPDRVMRPFRYPFCRRAKIRVTAHPTLRAARCPSLFPAGLELTGPQKPLRSAERPRPHHSAKSHQALDWRICGEQDAQPEESR
jgi:hypothetical protein